MISWHGRHIKKVDKDEGHSKVKYLAEKSVEDKHMAPLYEPWSPINRGTMPSINHM